MSLLYKFEPLLKQTLWGGNRLAAFKHLDMPVDGVGESWEVSDVDGSVSIVADNFPDWKSWVLLASAFAAGYWGKVNPIYLIIAGAVLGIILY